MIVFKKQQFFSRNITSDKMYQMFDTLASFRYLKTINIVGMTNNYQIVELYAMHAFRNCPRLKILRIKDFNMSVGFMKYIVTHGENLVGLELDFIMIQNTSDILSPFSTGMKNLKHLRLQNLKQSMYKTEDLLALVQNCEVLEILHLDECVTDDITGKLINLKKEKLKDIKINREFIGGSGKWIEQLLHCPKLEFVSVLGVPITKLGFEAISVLKNLKYLDLRSDIENPYNVDDIIKIFSNGKFKNLKTLRVSRFKGPIEALLMSASFACQNLQYLDLYCSNDTRKYFPKNIIKVLFDILTKLRELQLVWIVGEEDDVNPIFVISELLEINRNFKVEISEHDDMIKIKREI